MSTQPPYASPSEGQWPPGPPPRGQWSAPTGSWQQPLRPPSRVGPILAVVGALMVVAAVVLGLFVGRGMLGIVPSPADITPVSGETVVRVDEAAPLYLYAPVGRMPTCDIVGPTAEVPNISLGGVSYTFPLENQSYEAVARIGGPGQPEGEYTVTCDQPGLVVAPPVDLRGIFVAVGGLLGVTALGGTGFVLVVVGLILWLWGRRRRT